MACKLILFNYMIFSAYFISVKINKKCVSTFMYKDKPGFEGPMTSDEKESRFRGEEKLHYD